MSETPTIKPAAIASGASVSTSINIGGYSSGEPMGPTAILVPADTKGTIRYKVQVSQDDITYVDIFANGVIIPMPALIAGLILIPDPIQQGCIGFGFIRLVSMDARNAVAPASGAYTPYIVLCPLTYDNAAVPDGSASGAAAATMDPVFAAAQFAILMDILSTQHELLRETKRMRLGFVMAENNVCEDINPEEMDDDNDAWQ